MNLRHGTVRCEGPSAKTHPTAFPEYTKQDQGFKKYDGPAGPFAAEFDLANQLNIFPLTEEQYKEHFASAKPIHVPEKPQYSSNWERAVAYHHGLYMPEKCTTPKSADDIRLAVADFSAKVHQDAPKDACKYLQIEEFRCLNAHQFHNQPEVAAKKCMKWWDEIQKCQWDQAKFNAGTTYIEGPQMRRRRDSPAWIWPCCHQILQVPFANRHVANPMAEVLIFSTQISSTPE
ncbi:Uncharacterized protein SCF082_LOCUS6555 [Durusdinium trenchii]|uniref:Uncharacterized protein n=1 Tax=Durusdinium trenchii TaxID=1381693 RepID=A0ABP0IDB4_9DINO